MSNKENLFIGQKLYGQKSDQRGGVKGDIFTFTVSKISKIYFEVEETRDRFRIDTLRYENPEYSQFNYGLYFSKQEIMDKQEGQKLYSEIKNAFSSYQSEGVFSLPVLREIKKLINP